jgi:hypothetical protein
MAAHWVAGGGEPGFETWGGKDIEHNGGLVRREACISFKSVLQWLSCSRKVQSFDEGSFWQAFLT